MNSWSGLPSSNWASFVAQERLPQRLEGGPLHHSTPDANLAWLLAVMGSSEASSSSDADNSRTAGTCSPSAAEVEPFQTVYGTVTEFAPSQEFAGTRLGFVFKLGNCGIGYYRDVPPPGRATAALAAAHAAAAAVPSEPVELDLSSCKELLQQLAALSRGNRCVQLGRCEQQRQWLAHLGIRCMSM
jgi:hypothetical protein